MIIEGVDVSRHQDPKSCDWTAAANAGLRFAYIKGSEGAGGPDAYVDPAARDHADRVRQTRVLDTRVLPGMYHFARPDNRFASSPDGLANGRAEGEHAARTAIDLGLVDSALPVAIDLEKYTEDVSTSQRDDFVRGMVDTIKTPRRAPAPHLHGLDLLGLPALGGPRPRAPGGWRPSLASQLFGRRGSAQRDRGLAVVFLAVERRRGFRTRRPVAWATSSDRPQPLPRHWRGAGGSARVME